MIDTYKHKGLRKKMIEELREKGCLEGDVNSVVLSAMETVPRHCFIDTMFDAFAYQDRAFPIGDGQTISQPSTVLAQTTLLEVKEGDKILEVGTGSGYQAMVLDKLGADVYSIERQKELYIKTRKLLSELKSRVHTIFGDGYVGLEKEAPFDRILITCGAPFLPAKLLEQLKPNGILVVPLGDKEHIMTRIVKHLDGSVEETTHGSFHFVPMVSNKNVPQYPSCK